MALVNPNIAMSFRQPEFRPRNALAEYAQVQQIMGGQRQAEMADMQMEALRRKERAISQIQAAAVKHGGPADRREIAQAYIKSGVPEFMQIGLTMDKDLDELEAFDRIMGGGAAAPVPRAAAPGAAPSAVAAAPAPEGELVAEPLRPIPSPVTAPVAADAPAPAGETDRAYLQRQFGTPGGAAAGPNALAPAAARTTNAMLASAQPAAAPAGVAQTDRVAELRARRDQLLALGTPRALQAAKSLDTDIALMSKANTLSDRFVPVGNLVFDRQTEKFITPTEAQLALTRPQQARAPVAVLQNGRPVYVSPEQAVGQTPFTPASVQVLGMGPGREPPAPTITQIQDPTDPARMITIDARRYQGGGVGSPGVIGASGKAAPATTAALKQEQGASQAQDILDNLKFAYAELDRQKAIPSTQRSAISNLLTSIGTTGVGQVAGRAVGTEAQTQRDIIASARNQLFAAVKNATGLSAQNLNSNVEFTTWLNSLTDPAKSIEANREILANMEKFIASGGKYSAKGGGQAAPAAAPAGGATGGWSVVR